MALHRPGMYGLEKFEGFLTGIDKANPNKSDDLMLECIIKNRDGWTGNITMKHNLAHNKIEDYDISTNSISTSLVKIPKDPPQLYNDPAFDF